MQPNGIYNLSVDPENRSRSSKVGLLQGQTGTPVLALFLEGLSQERRFELHSLRDVETRLWETSGTKDKAAWETLLPFFESEGNRAHVVALPLSNDRTERLEQMVGKDLGLARRSGIHTLKSYRELADIAVFPQASILLKAEEHVLFHQALFNFLQEDPHFFALVDFPADFSKDQVLGWLKGVLCSNAAAFYPWLVYHEKAVPPAVVASAAFQLNDEKLGINHLPSNQPLKGPYQPLFNQLPAQLMDCLQHRLNSFHLFPSGEVKIWGGHTLADRLDFDSRFISTRRTAVAIQETIHKICEPFVLEPLYSGLEKMIDVVLQSAFQPLRHIFNPESKNPFETEVKIVEEQGQEIIKIGVRCSIPYSLDEMHFSLGLTG